MCNICDCDGGLKSLGEAGCPALFGRAYKYVFTTYFKSDGTVNELDLSSNPTLNKAYFDALLRANDPWIPSPEVMNYNTEREDDKFEEFNNGTLSLFVQQGKRSVDGIWVNISANIAGIIKEYNCYNVGFYVITDLGQLIGMEGSGYKKLAPIKIEKGSFSSKLMMQTNVALTVQKAMVKFNYDVTMCDSKLKMISPDSFTNYDIKSLMGLVQVQIKAFASATSTSVKVVLDTDQGAITDPILVEGLAAGDFTLYNISDAASVSITSVSETLGQYTIVYSAQTAGDKMRMTAEKDGYKILDYYYLAV